MTEKDLDVAIEKCERIMEMDTRTMQNPVSEDGWIFEKVYELLKFLRQFQFETDAKVGNMDDVISRQEAIEAMRKAKDKSEAHRMLVQLPSAQLAQDLTKGCTDTISRAAVGDALNGIEISRNASWYEFYQKALTAVGELPSAQPNLSEAYSKAVFTWLRDYQIRTAELKGRYTPYEVLSWVINDWRRRT